MPSLFQRKLTCFYCGGQSVSAPGVARYPGGRIRYFECPKCNAPNHLDEAGEIIDFVPESPKQPAPQFARRRVSPAPSSSFTASKPTPPPSPVFCRNCQNNQIIINTRIADYELPPDDHPDFDYHINVKFPEFRKQLELRYPVVCAECAPAVNNKIRTSNYKVKVASLGQMLARSGSRDWESGTRSAGTSPRRVFEKTVWLLRGFVWCYSHLLMLAWTGTGLLFPDRAAGLTLGVNEEETNLGSCLWRSFEQRDVVADCYEVVAGQATRFIPWSILGFFWIYWEAGLEKHPEKKLVGAKEYIWLEAGIYVFRMLCWALIARGWLALPREVAVRVHLGMFFLSFMSTLFSATCLKLEDPPSFSLREPSPIPGTPSPPSSPPQERVQSAYQTPPRGSEMAHQHSDRQIPPSTGASTSYSPGPPWRQREFSPTPSRSSHQGVRRGDPLSPDAMDWNPTEPEHALWSAPIPQPSFTSSFNSGPQPSHRQPQQEGSYRSPFSGKLPPAPKPPSHRLVSSLLSQKPAAQTPPTREQFFAHRQSESGFVKASDQNSKPASSKYPPLAPQRFFVQDDQTGLEGLFGPGLKLDDEPESLPPSTDSKEDGWVGISSRVVFTTACLGAVIKVEDHQRVCIGAVIAASGGLFWRERKRMRLLTGLAGFLTAGIISAGILLPPGDVRFGNATTAWLLTVIGTEFWCILMKLQRIRARTFYEDEKKKKLAVEMEIRRAKQGARNTGLSGLAI